VHVAHGFRLLMSHDRSRYMVLQPHPLAFVCLILVGFGLWLFCVLDVFDSYGIWLVAFLCACLVLMVIAFLIA
jgi:hypothetical protein